MTSKVQFTEYDDTISIQAEVDTANEVLIDWSAEDLNGHDVSWKFKDSYILDAALIELAIQEEIGEKV